MVKLGIVLLLGLAILPMLAAASGRRHSAVSYWVLAGVILWTTGLALTLGETSWPFLVLSHVAGPVSASLFLIGARHLAGLPPLSWIAGVGTAGALLTGIGFYVFGRGPAVAVQVAFSFPLLIASAWVVTANAWRRRASVSEKALGGVLFALALLAPVDSVIRMQMDADRILFPAWATLAFSIAFLTLAALGQRAIRHAKQLTHELRDRTKSLDLERHSLLALIESAPLGIALADPTGHLRYLNARGAELLDLGPPEAWTGRHASEIANAVDARLSPASRRHFAATFRSEFSAGQDTPRVDLELDAGSRILDLTSGLVRGRAGDPVGRLWICRDVTEERRMTERLSQAERMDTVGTLAGGIAHDFNNQLTAILANVDLLLGDLEGQERLWVETVEKSALHCAQLTQGLLTFAKRRPPSSERAAVETVVEEVAALLRPGLEPGTKLSVEVADGTGSILAASDELRRVLMNLGVNARDAVVGGGSVRIEARRLGGPGGERVELIVADDGIGMDDATRRHIFDPFFTSKEPGKGTGLGLSVAYGIAKNHAARIEVESSPGAGSTFRLLWPAAPLTSLDDVGPAPRVRATSGLGETILMGEDNALVRRSTRRMLERSGYRVIEAVDGPHLVEMFHAHASEVDLLLVDLAMPGCSGLDALNQIREFAPGLPAILMSGNPDPFVDRLPEGVEILLKPFRSGDLAARVQLALGSPIDDG